MKQVLCRLINESISQELIGKDLLDAGEVSITHNNSTLYELN